jgi:hypothetical protein
MSSHHVHAQVVSVDADRGCVYVMLPSGEIPGSFPARMLHHGYADAVRINQAPLPVKGTDGIVLLLYGSTHNAVWMGSLNLQGQDARTHPTDPDAVYDAHHSGAYDLMDGDGNWTKSFPDGTSITVAATAAPLAATRHTVDQTQTRTSTPYTAAQRRPVAASARHIVVQTGGGTTVHITPAGGVSVNLPAGQTLEFTQAGAAAADALVLVSKFLTRFNAHTHQNSGGSGTGGPPTTTLAAADVKTAVVQVSS